MAMLFLHFSSVFAYSLSSTKYIL